jgi:hypothetical protein
MNFGVILILLVLGFVMLYIAAHTVPDLFWSLWYGPCDKCGHRWRTGPDLVGLSDHYIMRCRKCQGEGCARAYHGICTCYIR